KMLKCGFGSPTPSRRSLWRRLELFRPVGDLGEQGGVHLLRVPIRRSGGRLGELPENVYRHHVFDQRQVLDDLGDRPTIGAGLERMTIKILADRHGQRDFLKIVLDSDVTSGLTLLNGREIRVTKSYQVQEFAELAGVTVRTLHHYDRLALLRPKRTGAGYRVYGIRDLERLEQIVALKFLGLPLKRIKNLLERDTRELCDVLPSQRRALEEKRR